MSVGLHCRLARPGRVAGLADFLDYAKSFHKDVWICTREEIADFWYDHHYPVGAGNLMYTESIVESRKAESADKMEPKEVPKKEPKEPSKKESEEQPPKKEYEEPPKKESDGLVDVSI